MRIEDFLNDQHRDGWGWFHYDPETGKLFRIKEINLTTKKGFETRTNFWGKYIRPSEIIPQIPSIESNKLDDFIIPELQGLYWSGERLFRIRELSVAHVGGSDRWQASQIIFNHRHVMSTHLIWWLMTGEWPDRFIDHINNDGSDHRWSNLRLATRQQNGQNKQPPSNKYTSDILIKGVCETRSGIFSVTIGKKWLGCFPNHHQANWFALDWYEANHKEWNYYANAGATEAQAARDACWDHAWAEEERLFRLQRRPLFPPPVPELKRRQLGT